MSFHLCPYQRHCLLATWQNKCIMNHLQTIEETLDVFDLIISHNINNINNISNNNNNNEQTAKTALPPKRNYNGIWTRTSYHVFRTFRPCVLCLFIILVQCNSSNGNINCFVLSAPIAGITIARLSEDVEPCIQPIANKYIVFTLNIHISLDAALTHLLSNSANSTGYDYELTKTCNCMA